MDLQSCSGGGFLDLKIKNVFLGSEGKLVVLNVNMEMPSDWWLHIRHRGQDDQLFLGIWRF